MENETTQFPRTRKAQMNQPKSKFYIAFSSLRKPRLPIGPRPVHPLVKNSTHCIKMFAIGHAASVSPAPSSSDNSTIDTKVVSDK